MPSTYSTNLAIELIGTGDQAGVWGNTTNTNLGTLIEQAISGYVTQAVSTGTDTTITIPNGATGVARNMYIELTGTGGASTNLIVPSNKKLYFIFNNTSSGQVTVKVSGQTGVSVPNGAKVVLASNGTDVVTATNYTIFGAGTAALPSITTAGDTNTGIFFPAADTIAFAEGGVEALRIDSSANVGIGTSSPATKLDVNGITQSRGNLYGGTSNTTANVLAYANVANGGAGFSQFLFANTSTETRGYLTYTHASDALLIGTAGATKATLDSSGNLGLGVTPSAWGSGSKAFQLQGGALWSFTNAYMQLQQNAYYDGSNYKYTNTASATLYEQTAGQHKWLNAASGTAGSTISFTQAMTLTSGGDLGIGTTSPTAGYRLTASDSTGGIRIESSSTAAGNQPRIEFFHTGNDSFQIRAGGGLSFWQSSVTEVMRIAFGGEVYIAGFADQGAYNLQVAGTGVWGAGAYVNGSDARLKDNIQSLDSGLDVVKAMRAVTFQYKPEHSKDQSVQPGFIAQELQQAMAGKPYLDGVVQAGPEYLNVAYQNIIPILVKAIQELEAKVAALEAK